MFAESFENLEIVHAATGLEISQGSATFSSIGEALAGLQAGRMIVVVDDADRENEGDLIIAATMITPSFFFSAYISLCSPSPLYGTQLSPLVLVLFNFT